MAVHCEQASMEERERILNHVENGEMSVHRGARSLNVPYTTIVSRIYRGSSIKEAFTKPIEKKVKRPGNAAWQALGD